VKLINIQIIKGVIMKFLKIILIIVLLLVMCFSISLGTGTITSGDKTIYLCPEPEEPTSLDEWFHKLPLMEKVEIYTFWSGVVYAQNKYFEE